MKNKLNEIMYGEELANNLEEINNKELKEKFIEFIVYFVYRVIMN